jgi:hypothetical protein
MIEWLIGGTRVSPRRSWRLLAFAISGSLLCASLACGDVISITGPVIGASGIDGLAEGWSMSFGGDFSISAYFDNDNGSIPDRDNTAYMTSGSLPSLNDVVASTHFNLPGNYDGMFTLFSNVSLSEGDYWLILASPGPPDSYASWVAADPASVNTASGVQYLGYADSDDHDVTFGAPVIDAFAYEFTVNAVPEPSSLALCLAVIAASECFRLLFLKRSNTGSSAKATLLE